MSSSLIGGRESQPYAELAARLGMSEGAVKVAVHLSTQTVSEIAARPKLPKQWPHRGRGRGDSASFACAGQSVSRTVIFPRREVSVLIGQSCNLSSAFPKNGLKDTIWKTTLLSKLSQTARPKCADGLMPGVPYKGGLSHGRRNDFRLRAPPAFVPPPVEELAKLFPQLEILQFIGRAEWALFTKRGRRNSTALLR